MNTSDWQSIETAPRDGTHVLLANGYGMQVCWWDYDTLWERQKHWIYGECEGEYNSYPVFDNPTHWMPLPERP